MGHHATEYEMEWPVIVLPLRSSHPEHQFRRDVSNKRSAKPG